MRLGGPLFDAVADPQAWVRAMRAAGYRAGWLPLRPDVDDATLRAWTDAACAADIVIAEVGAWSNPISPDRDVRDKAMAKCIDSLALAERLGARCCVNIAGSRAAKWDGPHPDNLAPETFDLIVESVRRIIDAVRPVRTFYTLETMPWVFPDSADNYLRLLRAVDRPAFAVHFDPVNLVNCPQRAYRSGDLIRDFVARLGPWIKSTHAKDIALQSKLTVHLDEVRPGTGCLDYHVFLSELARLDRDLPLMLEHLPTAEEYALAAGHIRQVAQQAGIPLV